MNSLGFAIDVRIELLARLADRAAYRRSKLDLVRFHFVGIVLF